MLGTEWVLNEAHGSLTCMLSNFYMALSLNQILNASLSKGTKEDIVRDKQPPLPGTSFWIAPKSELVGGAKAQSGVGLAVAGCGGEHAAAQEEDLCGSAPTINEGEGSKRRLWSCP